MAYPHDRYFYYALFTCEIDEQQQQQQQRPEKKVVQREEISNETTI